MSFIANDVGAVIDHCRLYNKSVGRSLTQSPAYIVHTQSVIEWHHSALAVNSTSLQCYFQVGLFTAIKLLDVERNLLHTSHDSNSMW